MKKNRGSLYFLTLASALILVALVLGTVSIIMQFRQYSRTSFQGELAQHYAQHGINHALFFTNIEPNWRNMLTSGIWLQDIAVDQATYTVEGIDTVDGDLATGANDPILFISTATVDGVSRSVQVQVTQETTPHELFNYAVAAGGNIDINNHARINGNITTNIDVDKTGADTWIFGDVEAVGIITETNNVSGTITEGADPKDFPDYNAIFTYYQAHATPIAYTPLIEDKLISHINNPYGPVNPDGLYKINCANQKIVIKDCRIVGTLVLINPKSDSTIEAAINWQPARPDYPALIIDGIFTIKPDKDLDEAQRNTDFSLPAESGAGSITDVYPNEIRGLIYSNNTLVVDKDFTLQGTIISDGMVDLKSNAAVTYDPSILDNPPPGFSKTLLQPVPGTWRELIR